MSKKCRVGELLMERLEKGPITHEELDQLIIERKTIIEELTGKSIEAVLRGGRLGKKRLLVRVLKL